MNLSQNFTLEELTDSEIAIRQGIDNSASTDVIVQLTRLSVTLLEPIRSMLRAPMIASSGYRCLRLNRGIGSADSSDHLWGGACDFTAPQFGNPYEVALAISRNPALPFDQLIFEFGRWVHVGIARPGVSPRRQCLTYFKPRQALGGIVHP